MKLAMILSAIFLCCQSAFAMPKVGDTLSVAMEISENGKVTIWSTSFLEYLSFDVANDVFTIRSTTKDSSGKNTVRNVTQTGSALRNLDNVQLYAMQNDCGPAGRRTEVLTLRGGQTIVACKEKLDFPDGHSDVYYSAILPGWRFVKETNSRKDQDGLLVESVTEVTGFTSN